MRARSSSRICPAVAIGLTLAAMAGCGDPAKLLPADDASAMDGALQRVADATIAGDCQAAGAALAEAQDAFAGLPAGVSPALRKNIADGLAQLTRTVPEQCTDPGTSTETTPTETTTQTAPTETTTQTTPTETTPTQTTPTETTPTQTTPTQTTPTQTQPDPGGITPDEGGAPAQQGGAG